MVKDQNPVHQLELQLSGGRYDFSLYDLCRCTHYRRDHAGGSRACVLLCVIHCLKFQINLEATSVPDELKSPPVDRKYYHLTLNTETFQWLCSIFGLENQPTNENNYPEIAIEYLTQQLRRDWGIVDYHNFHIVISDPTVNPKLPQDVSLD
jgi:hypothetical protein